MEKLIQAFMASQGGAGAAGAGAGASALPTAGSAGPVGASGGFSDVGGKLIGAFKGGQQAQPTQDQASISGRDLEEYLRKLEGLNSVGPQLNAGGYGIV